MAAPVHEHVRCDGCGIMPIVGIRYKCVNCPNYDVCEDCELRDAHNLAHAFIKLRRRPAYKADKQSTPLVSILIYDPPATSNPPASPREYWTCQACELHNDLWRLHCEVCFRARGDAPKEADSGASSPREPPVIPNTLLLPPVPSASVAVPLASLRTLAAGVAEVGAQLFAKLCAEEESDVFVSPFAVALALSAVAMGATAESAAHTQLRALLGHNLLGDEETMLAAAAQLLRTIVAADPKVRLVLANAVWATRAYGDYVELIKEVFDADARKLNGPEPINSWCSGRTQGLITRIVEEVSSDCPSVIVSAVALKATWQVGFDPALTREATFHAFTGDVRCSMMHRGPRAETYVVRADVQAVELGYGASGRFSAVLLRPVHTGPAALAALVASLSAPWWATMCDSLAAAERSPQPLVLGVPRFIMDYGVKVLNGALVDVGVTAPFCDADLRRLGPATAFVEAVLHKAVTEVNEDGLCAPTVLDGDTDVVAVVFDQPFLFAVRDRTTDALLFLGRVMVPLSAPS